MKRLATSAVACDERSRNSCDLQLADVYSELKRVARAQLRRQHLGLSLAPTELVHEAFLKMNGKQPEVKSREHFLALAAQCMRWILVDTLRARKRGKRGGELLRVQLKTEPISPNAEIGLTDLEEAMRLLEQRDEQLAKVVTFRYLVGLTVDETAALMGLSPATIKRDWKLARAWLLRELMAEKPK